MGFPSRSKIDVVSVQTNRIIILSRKSITQRSNRWIAVAETDDFYIEVESIVQLPVFDALNTEAASVAS